MFGLYSGYVYLKRAKNGKVTASFDGSDEVYITYLYQKLIIYST